MSKLYPPNIEIIGSCVDVLSILFQHEFENLKASKKHLVFIYDVLFSMNLFGVCNLHDVAQVYLFPVSPPSDYYT